VPYSVYDRLADHGLLLRNFSFGETQNGSALHALYGVLPGTTGRNITRILSGIEGSPEDEREGTRTSTK
jgi:hypothetical protein